MRAVSIYEYSTVVALLQYKYWSKFDLYSIFIPHVLTVFNLPLTE